MESNGRLKAAVILLGIFLFVSLGVLGWALWQNYWWKQSVNHVADEAGASWAMASFRRGRLTIWEQHPTNDFPRFSGRRDGPFEIWVDDYYAGLPGPWRYAQRRKLEAHNNQMRYMYEHPERFTPGVDERK